MRPDRYTRVYLWLVSHRRWALGVTLLVTSAALVILSQIDWVEDSPATLPRRDPLVGEYRDALRKFRDIDRVYVDVGINADEPERLAAAADRVYAALSTNEAYLRIKYRFDGGTQQKLTDYLTGSLPNLFTEADAKALAPKLEPDQVREYLTGMQRKLAGMEGLEFQEAVGADPIGMRRLVEAKVLPLQTGFSNTKLVDGRITSPDGRHILLVAEPRFPSANSQTDYALVKHLVLVAGEVEKQFPGVYVAVSGRQRMSADNVTLINADVTRCVSIGTAAMLILWMCTFRRRWLAILTFLPSLFGTLVAGAALALWWRHLPPITAGFAAIAIGITVNYAVHIIYQLDNAPSIDQASVGRHVGRLVMPVGIAVLTTIAVFLMMTSSRIPGYQQPGVVGAISVLFSAAFALAILPLIVPRANVSGQPPLWLTRLMERFHAWQSRRQPWLLIAVLALTIMTTFGARRLRVEGDIAKLNSIAESTRRDEALINKTWGDAPGRTVIVARGATFEEALAQNDRAYEALARDSTVAAVYSLSSVCPSAATQEANLRRWRQFWTPTRRAVLRQRLQMVGGELGLREQVFARFRRIVEGKPPFLTLDLFRGTSLEEALSDRVAAGAGDNAVTTLVELNDRGKAGELRQALPGIIVLDHEALTDRIAGLAKKGLGKFAWWSGIVVAAILYFSFGSVELTVATLLPLAFGLLWTFGAMGWLGLPMDLMSGVLLIFIIGVCKDYSVFQVTNRLDEWRGRPPRTAATRGAVLISGLTIIAGFGALLLANHPVLHSIGRTGLLGMGFALAATLILTPLCMDLLLFNNPPRGAPRWWHPLGTLWVIIHLGGSQLFLYYLLRPVLKIVSPRRADDTLRRATRCLARGLVKGLPFGKLEFQNILPATFSPPCIVISNHQSAVDVMLIVSLPGDVRQTAKKRVFDEPMLGIGCKLLGHVMVEPNDPEITLRRCRERLAEGACVHFYPEGTRSPDGSVQRFHRGAFELAVELKQDILPIVLCDTNTAIPRDAYWFEPYHSTVSALPRITPKTFDYSQGSLALMRHAETLVREALQTQLDGINTLRVVRRKVGRLYRYQGKFVEQFVYWKMKLDPVFATLDSVVPRKGFILDLGCGYGMATHWLAAFTDGRSFLGVDYDEDKIRVAQRTAPEHARIGFQASDILNTEYPACDTILLLDVLHYWQAEKQQLILDKARRALRPGGRLVLRDGARAETGAHRRVHRWEEFATRTGHNRTQEGLHFQTLEDLATMLKRAGFADWEVKRGAGRDSNVLLLARV